MVSLIAQYFVMNARSPWTEIFTGEPDIAEDRGSLLLIVQRWDCSSPLPCTGGLVVDSSTVAVETFDRCTSNKSPPKCAQIRK